MPVPSSSDTFQAVFPTLTRNQVDAARTSSWYKTFRDITPASTIIDLDRLEEKDSFLHWLEADSIFLPEGSSSTTNIASSSTSSSHAPVYRLPRLNDAIRSALTKYGGAVFPKLNWTSPRDAAFILPQTAHGPLYCVTPADVYLLLKSSDFISHDLDPHRVYTGCEDEPDSSRLKIELVLRRFVDLNPSRELRCFVRNNLLIGISQRDLNFYDHLQPHETREKIRTSMKDFWEDEIRDHYNGGPDYVFDVYLSANFTSASIIDFQPYRATTDPLLFTYEDLLEMVQSISPEATSPSTLPVFKIIDNRSHPSANRNAPTYQSNMLPLEMLQMSEGQHMGDFKAAWEEAIAAGMQDDSDEESS